MSTATWNTPGEPESIDALKEGAVFSSASGWITKLTGFS